MGMLQDNAQRPSSGPVANTPPGSSSSTGFAAGSEQLNSPEFKQLRNKGIEFLYSDRFEPMLKMFRTNGADGFPRSMAIAVNTTIKEMEKAGPVSPQLMTEAWADIFMTLLEDIVLADDVLPGLSVEQVSRALPAVMEMYEKSHPEIKPGTMQKVLDNLQMEAAQAIKDNPEMQQGSKTTPEPGMPSPGGTGEAMPMQSEQPSQPSQQPLPSQQTPTGGY